MTFDQARHAPEAATARISPAFDPGRMFTSMLQFGEFVVRAQERMFSAFLGTSTSITNAKDTGHDGADDARSTADQSPVIVVVAADELTSRMQEEEDADTHRLIAARAQEIAASPQAHGELDNWLQAERELSAAGRIGPA